MASYSLITSPDSLVEVFASGAEKGVPARDVVSCAQIAARDERTYPRDRQGLVYHSESLEAINSGLANEIREMVTYWWGRYRDAMAEVLLAEGCRVIQSDITDLSPDGTNQYFPIRGSDLGYKLEKSKETTNQSGTASHAFHLSVPRDFRGFHPNLMPERIAHIDRPVGMTNITFAPFLKHRGAFLEVMSALSIRERAAYLLDICLAVHTLHTSRYIHMDLKPDNMVFDLQGTRPKVYIVDMEGAWRHGEVLSLHISLSYNPSGYYRDWEENIQYIPQLDAFSLAHIILESLCGERKYESLVAGMIDDQTYDIKDSDDVLAFLDQFFSQVVDAEGGAIPDQLKTVLKSLLRWRKDEIPYVKDLCNALSHGYEIDARWDENSKPVVIHDSDQKSQTR